MQHTLTFSTVLAAPPAEVWQWITSFSCISREMAPYLKMSTPPGVVSLTSMSIVPGTRLFRSWIKLFGVIPVDYSDLTLVSLDAGKGFVEQSPMGTMRSWQHERRIEPLARGSMLTDTLVFEPRVFDPLFRYIVRAFFTHRHRMLQRHLGKLV